MHAVKQSFLGIFHLERVSHKFRFESPKKSVCVRRKGHMYVSTKVKLLEFALLTGSHRDVSQSSLYVTISICSLLHF